MALAAPLVACGKTTPVERPVAFSSLSGWNEEGHAAAFTVFKRFCAHETPKDAALAAVCAAASAAPAELDERAARAFFETHFTPVEIVPAGTEGRYPGFLTGYYEPEFEGSLTQTETFQAPLLARPNDLESLPPGESFPGLPEGLQFARRKTGEAGGVAYEPYPDRAAIEDGALGDKAVPLVYLREPGEAFIVQVQGSTRIRLQDGKVVRVAYAGKNGHPYSSIGKIIVERGAMPLESMTLASLLGWLREHPTEARDVMRMNRSFVFFRLAEELAPEDGPVGAAGMPLTPGSSLAVDQKIWSYGLPVWLETELPIPGMDAPLQRLTIALDTGSAIIGPARGDFFWGWGPGAGTWAGDTRHKVRFVVLKPVLGTAR